MKAHGGLHFVETCGIPVEVTVCTAVRVLAIDRQGSGGHDVKFQLTDNGGRPTNLTSTECKDPRVNFPIANHTTTFRGTYRPNRPAEHRGLGGDL